MPTDNRPTTTVVTDIPPNPMTVQERLAKKAMLVTALERGIVNDRLKVDLPAHLHGEWVRKDPLEIDRLKSLGFEIDTVYAPKRAVHSDGSGGATIVDVVHMICPREVKDILNEIEHDKFIHNHGKPGRGAEERDFQNQMAVEPEIKPIVESASRNIGVEPVVKP